MPCTQNDDMIAAREEIIETRVRHHLVELEARRRKRHALDPRARCHRVLQYSS